jgi:hypothetical protein
MAVVVVVVVVVAGMCVVAVHIGSSNAAPDKV